jgi:hypothetical protein
MQSRSRAAPSIIVRYTVVILVALFVTGSFVSIAGMVLLQGIILLVLTTVKFKASEPISRLSLRKRTFPQWLLSGAVYCINFSYAAYLFTVVPFSFIYYVAR